MSIDNLLDCLFEKEKCQNIHTPCRHRQQWTLLSPISNRSIPNGCVSSSKKAKTLLRKKKKSRSPEEGRIKRNKLLRIIQICYRKLRSTSSCSARFFSCCAELTMMTETLMKLTLFCARLLHIHKIMKIANKYRMAEWFASFYFLHVVMGFFFIFFFFFFW